MLVRAVVVAGDRARADVAPRADRRVAEVGQVTGLAALAQPGLLQLDEVAHAAVRLEYRARPQMREGADLRSVPIAAFEHHAVVPDLDAVAQPCMSATRQPERITQSSPTTVAPSMITSG